MHSIRRKLLITLIGALLAAGFTTAAATFFSAQTEFNKFLDTHLKETAESLAQSVTHSFPLADPDHLTIIGDAQSYHIVVQVYDSANNTVWQREDQPYLPLPDAPGFARAKLNGVNADVDQQFQSAFCCKTDCVFCVKNCRNGSVARCFYLTFGRNHCHAFSKDF